MTSTLTSKATSTSTLSTRLLQLLLVATLLTRTSGMLCYVCATRTNPRDQVVVTNTSGHREDLEQAEKFETRAPDDPNDLAYPDYTNQGTGGASGASSGNQSEIHSDIPIPPCDGKDGKDDWQEIECAASLENNACYKLEGDLFEKGSNGAKIFKVLQRGCYEGKVAGTVWSHGVPDQCVDAPSGPPDAKAVAKLCICTDMPDGENAALCNKGIRTSPTSFYAYVTLGAAVVVYFLL